MTLPPLKLRVPSIPGLSVTASRRVRNFLLAGLGEGSWPLDERFVAASGRFGVGVEVLRRAFGFPRRGRDPEAAAAKAARAGDRVRAARAELRRLLAIVRAAGAVPFGPLPARALADDEALRALAADAVARFGPVPPGSRGGPSWFAEAALEGALGAALLGGSRRSRRRDLAARLGERRRPRRRRRAELVVGRPVSR